MKFEHEVLEFHGLVRWHCNPPVIARRFGVAGGIRVSRYALMSSMAAASLVIPVPYEPASIAEGWSCGEQTPDASMGEDDVPCGIRLEPNRVFAQSTNSNSDSRNENRE